MTQIINMDPVVAGDNISFDLRFRDSDGNPLNVAGDTLYVTFKSSLSLPDANAEMQVSYAIPDNDYTRGGVVTFPITKDDSNVAEGTYHYDFQWVKSASASGEVETVFIGSIKVLKGVTLT